MKNWIWTIAAVFILSLYVGIAEIREEDEKNRCVSYFVENERSHAGMRQLAGADYAFCLEYSHEYFKAR